MYAAMPSWIEMTDRSFMSDKFKENLKKSTTLQVSKSPSLTQNPY